MKKDNKKLIERLKKQEIALEKTKTKTKKEVDLEKKISKLTGKVYKGNR